MNLFGGDFNINHPHWGSETANSEGTEFLNHIAHSNYKILNNNNPSYTHLHNSPPHKKSSIDLTLISKNMTCNKWQILHSEYNKSFSDHIPILTQIQTSSKHGFDTAFQTWNLNSKYWNKFTDQIKTKIQQTEFNEKPNTHAYELCKLIIEIAENTIGYKYYYHGHKPWWNKTIEKLKRHVRRLSRKLQRIKKYCKTNNRDHIINLNYIRIKKIHRKKYNEKESAINKAKSKHTKQFNKHIETSANFSRKFWKGLEQNNNKKPTNKNIPPLKIKTNNNTIKIVENPKEQVFELHSAMTKPPYIENSGKYNNHYNYIKNYVNEYNKDPNKPKFTKLIKNSNHNPINEINKTNKDNPNEIQPNPINQNLNSNILNDPIKKYEIQQIIKNLDNYKALGPDKIHNQMLKKAGEPLINELVILFNKILYNKKFPSCWGLTNILPIPKPHRDHSDPTQYRPIALSSCLGKVLEKIIAKRLQTFCVKHKIFNNLQCAFQINRSCDDILTTFISDVQTSFDMISDTDVIFTDFSKAYDCVWHNGLIYKLIQAGIHGTMLQLLKSYITTRHTKVITPNAESRFAHQNIGVPQGSAISPILYILYTNDYIIKNPNFVQKACFADDTAFWTKPASKSTLRYKKLQDEINNFTE